MKTCMVEVEDDKQVAIFFRKESRGGYQTSSGHDSQIISFNLVEFVNQQCLPHHHYSDNSVLVDEYLHY